MPSVQWMFLNSEILHFAPNIRHNVKYLHKECKGSLFDWARLV